jgi:hypothetical protein
MWQEIEGSGHFCHWWQECNGRRITAMSTDSILIALTFTLGMIAGLVALVHFVRHDSFAGPGTARHERDELGSRAQHRLAA